MTIEERLANMESQLKQLRKHNRALLGGIILVSLIATFPLILGVTASRAGAQAPGVLKEIAARKFSLDDGKGNLSAVLTANESGPFLALYDNKQKGRAALVVSENGPSLFLLDEEGNMRIIISIGKLGPEVRINDKNGLPAAFLTTEGDESRLVLSEPTNKFSTIIKVNKAGANLSVARMTSLSDLRSFETSATSAGITAGLYQSSFMPRAQMAWYESGPSFELYDAKNKTRFVAGCTSTQASSGVEQIYPESSIILFDSNEKVIWSAIR